MSTRRVLLAALVLCTSVAAPGRRPLGAVRAEAQDLWTEASSLGYSALGLGVAAAVIVGGKCGGCALGAGIGVAAGGIGFGLGQLIGTSAESAARRGERPSRGQLTGVRIGTVLAGASLGAIAGGVGINRNQLKNPARDLLILSILGAAVGVWVEHGQEAWLRRAPVAALGLAAKPTVPGRWALDLAVRTTW